MFKPYLIAQLVSNVRYVTDPGLVSVLCVKWRLWKTIS